MLLIEKLKGIAVSKRKRELTKDGVECSWLYLIGSETRSGETKIGIAAIDVLERFKNLRTADPNLYIEAAYLLPDWYAGTIRKEEQLWHNFFSEPTVMETLAGDQHVATIENGIANSTRISFRNSNAQSEWFKVSPNAAFRFITRFIMDQKKHISYKTNFWHIANLFAGPCAFDDTIWVYSEDALLFEYDNVNYPPGKQEDPARPI